MNNKISECPRCLFTADIAKIGEKQCEYCDIHDDLAELSNPKDLDKYLNKIRANKKSKYNCLVGISGGLDSSILLYTAMKKWGLRPLAIHFDNNWNTEIAKENMKNLTDALGVDVIIYKANKKEYDDLNDAFLFAGVPDADIPNDIAMTKLMYETADRYGIKYILNGHDFRQEGSTPRAWTYMDAEYIRSVYRFYTNSELKYYPLFTFKDQILYSMKGIKNIRPFHYMQNREYLEKEMIALCGWKSYGAKHAENIYTEFVGAHLLPQKFNIDKRIVYLAACVRSNKIGKAEAKGILDELPEFKFEKLGERRADIMRLVEAAPIRPRKEFGKYNFRAYRPLIYIMAKMRIVPYTFYKKYCF